MSETKKLIEAIEKLTDELKRANDRQLPTTYIPYPVPQPYPVYPIYTIPYYPYYPPLTAPVYTPISPWTGTCGGGIGASNVTVISNNSVDATASYQQ